MTIAEYDTYFEDIAKRLKAVQHTDQQPRYANYHIEEVLTGLRADLDMRDYCLLQEDIEGKIVGKANENADNLQSGAVMILRHVALDDFKEERVVLDKALKLAIQVAAKMVKDKEISILTKDLPKFLRGLDISMFSYQKVGPVFDRCFGYRLEFQYVDSTNLIMDPEEWIIPDNLQPNI